MLHIALSGAKGRMGQCVQTLINQSPEITLAATFDREQSVEKHLKTLNNPTIDVWIDFTHPNASLQYLDYCLKHHIKMVIGTTGFSNQQQALIKKVSRHIPILLAPNMSIGLNILLKLLAVATKATANLADADIAITDIHHRHKKDKPSGTALSMAQIIQEANPKTKVDHTSIMSLRVGDIIGEHSVRFALAGEQFILSHQVTDRHVFASGAIKAAQWLHTQKPGLYDMADVLVLNQAR
jgi:4-hydroxy-tetrahydrodipicolinate reductase